MNTRHYLYVTTIADLGSITAAAKHLGISTSALSKFLKNLQKNLGVTLFFPYHKRLYLTESGKTYYQAAQKILTVQNNMLNAVRKHINSGSDTIRIATPPNLGFETYNRTLHRFISLFPGSRITISEIYSRDQETAIHEHRINFAFGASIHENYTDVRNILISRSEIFLAVPRHHPIAKLSASPSENPCSVSLRDFSDYSFVLCDTKNNIRKEADLLFEQAGFSPIIAFESSNSLSVEFMLRSGAGIGFLTNRYAGSSDADLVFFRLDPPCYETYYFRCPADHTLSNEEQCLAALYSQELIHVVNSELVHNADVDAFFATLNRYTGGNPYVPESIHTPQ